MHIILDVSGREPHASSASPTSSCAQDCNLIHGFSAGSPKKYMAKSHGHGACSPREWLQLMASFNMSGTMVPGQAPMNAVTKDRHDRGNIGSGRSVRAGTCSVCDQQLNASPEGLCGRSIVGRIALLIREGPRSEDHCNVQILRRGMLWDWMSHEQYQTFGVAVASSQGERVAV